MPWRETCAMEERLKLLLEWDGGDISVSELCRHYGISRKTGYKWLHRYRSEGAGGLSDRSRAPLHHPQAMGAAVEAAVLEVRLRYPSWGAKKIRAHLERQQPDSHRRGRRLLPAAMHPTRCGVSTSRAGSSLATGPAATR